MYQFLDYFFLVFHSAIIIFNLFGWIWKKTKKANLVTLTLTGASWFLLGIFYGIGYCPVTEWHWKVLRKLGETDLPYSYVKYLAQRLLGLDINPDLIESITLFSFIAALLFSAFFNFIYPQIKKKHHKNL